MASVGDVDRREAIQPGISKTTGITDSQIRADLQSAISSGQLSTPTQWLYVVYVEPGVAIKLGTDPAPRLFWVPRGFAGKTPRGERPIFVMQ